jgi:hypothetical protein
MKKVYVGTQYIERESKNPDRNLKNTIMDECIPTIRIPNTMGSELVYSLFAQRKFKMKQPSSIIFFKPHNPQQGKHNTGRFEM